jgi:hypothetical protein
MCCNSECAAMCDTDVLLWLGISVSSYAWPYTLHMRSPARSVLHTYTSHMVRIPLSIMQSRGSIDKQARVVYSHVKLIWQYPISGCFAMGLNCLINFQNYCARPGGEMGRDGARWGELAPGPRRDE